MNNQFILFALLLSVISSTNDTNLNTNTNFLLLMLLALNNNGSNFPNSNCCSHNTCPGQSNFFI